jgi:hypothetical protein
VFALRINIKTIAYRTGSLELKDICLEPRRLIEPLEEATVRILDLIT